MILLTIITPTFKRPIGLDFCRATVAAQVESREIQHLIVRDDIGKGVAGMYRDLPLVNEQIKGEWVFVLSDDDCLIYPALIPSLRAIVLEHQPDVIMVPQYYNGRLLPDPRCWHAPPECGFVTLSNWIVKRELHTRFPYGARYEGDFDFISAVWKTEPRIAWWGQPISATQRGANFGRAE